MTGACAVVPWGILIAFVLFTSRLTFGSGAKIPILFWTCTLLLNETSSATLTVLLTDTSEIIIVLLFTYKFLFNETSPPTKRRIFVDTSFVRMEFFLTKIRL